MSQKNKVIFIAAAALAAVLLLLLLCCLLKSNEQSSQIATSPTEILVPEHTATVPPTEAPSTPAPTVAPTPEPPTITPPAVFSVDTTSASDILIHIVPPSSDSDIQFPEDAK